MQLGVFRHSQVPNVNLTSIPRIFSNIWASLDGAPDHPIYEIVVERYTSDAYISLSILYTHEIWHGYQKMMVWKMYLLQI